jgi:hypothetical protein
MEKIGATLAAERRQISHGPVGLLDDLDVALDHSMSFAKAAAF